LSEKIATFIHVILVRKTKLHLKREIHHGNPAFKKFLSDSSEKEFFSKVIALLKKKNTPFGVI